MPGQVIQGFFVGPAGPPSPAFSNSFEIDPVKLGFARGGGQPLAQPVLAKMEAAFGADFSTVRVHVGPQASRIGAVAFTTGNDIYFAPGRYQPGTIQGQQLLGHELAHVIQQRQGRVRAPGSGVAVVQDRVLEAEADRMGARAAAQPMKAPSPVPLKAARPGPPSIPARLVQRHPIERVRITGLTHLRESNPGFASLVHGTDYAEVRYPETVTIDRGDIWDSHLGMNLARSGGPENVWYRVVEYRGARLLGREVYLRSGMFQELSPLARLSPQFRAMIAGLPHLDARDQAAFSQVEKATSVYGLTASRNQWLSKNRRKPPWATSGSRHGARMAEEDTVIRKVRSHFALVKWDSHDEEHLRLRAERSADSGGTPDYVLFIDGELILGDTFTFMLPTLITNQLVTITDEARSKMSSYSGKSRSVHRPRVFVAINFVNYFLIHIVETVAPALAEALRRDAQEHGAIVVLVGREGFYRLF